MFKEKIKSLINHLDPITRQKVEAETYTTELQLGNNVEIEIKAENGLVPIRVKFHIDNVFITIDKNEILKALPELAIHGDITNFKYSPIPK